MTDANTRVHLLGLTTQELEQFARSIDQPKFRGKQIAAWIYKKGADSFAEMSDLPASLRDSLEQHAVIGQESIKAVSQAPDGTTKFLIEMEDAQSVESVLLPYPDRISACVSTQVGCAAGCSFCATGMGGFARNLTAGEIVGEVLTLQRKSERRISHVVYMGMGEPLLNYNNVVKSIYLLNDEVGIAMRHITVSTVGVTPRITRLADEKLQITLAVSLHAPNDHLRRKIIPLAAKYPLDGLMDACRHYTETTHRRITFEYLLIRGVNDSPGQAQQLASLLRGMLCGVNLIPYNAVENLDMDRPSQEQIRAFRSVLEKTGISVTQRMERGHSVAAACGQLRRQETT